LSKPTQFTAVVEAAGHSAGFSEGKYRAPPSVPKSGGVIRKLAEMKQGKTPERAESDAEIIIW